jgi:DNA-binding response OmpR family regulator
MKASPGFLSAEALLEQVWDENADPFTKTVQVTISRLRRKLGEPQVIETLPAVGYRIKRQFQCDGPSAAQAASATIEIEEMP